MVTLRQLIGSRSSVATSFGMSSSDELLLSLFLSAVSNFEVAEFSGLYICVRVIHCESPTD